MNLAILAAVCGGMAGGGGLVHGVGEALQGSRPPEGMVFNSWAEGPIAENLGGEPAMTLVPNLLMTGILAVGVSLALISFSVGFLKRRRAGGVLVLLSVLLLSVGGGFGPPVLGMLAGLAAGGAHARPQTWEPRLAGTMGRFLALSWAILFWVAAVNAVFLVAGSFVVGAALDLAAPDAFVYSLFLAVVTVPLATIAGIAHRVRSGAGHDAEAPAAPSGKPR